MERWLSVVDRWTDGSTMLAGTGLIAWAIGRLHSVEASVLFVGVALVTASGLSILARRSKPNREPKEDGI
jgi:hypothetical protein